MAAPLSCSILCCLTFCFLFQAVFTLYAVHFWGFYLILTPLGQSPGHTSRIPSCCQQKELAEAFINYMLEEEPAIANAEYIMYGCPNRVVYESEEYAEDMGEEAMEILYPNLDDFAEKYNRFAYRNLDPETLSLVNTLWEELKIN